MSARWRLPLLLALMLGCATPLDEGEKLYREGDRRGALEVWRAVEPDDPNHSALAERIEKVEQELDTLVVGYVESARLLESEGRLAESVLDFRLALVQQPDDEATLAHVQRLARELVQRKSTLAEEYQLEIERNDLEGARLALTRLRTLDPFDPSYETEERQLVEALNSEWRARRQRYRARLAGEVEGLVDEGREAFREERLDAALDAWRRALMIDPDNERIQAYIARAERQLENLERLRATQPPEDEG